MDEDCDGYVCGETLWVQQFGVQSTTASPTDIAVDGQTGDIYVAGSFSGALPIGSDMLDSQGFPTVAFLAKFDPQGTPLWAKQFGGGGANTAQSKSVALDGQGNVVLIGTANPTVNLGDGDLPSGVFIGKFASSGQLLWSQACQSDEPSFLQASGAVDRISGDVFVAGSFYDPGTITCGNVSLTGAQDVFVSRLAASDGSVVFATSYGGDDGGGTLNDIVVDEQGSIFITGSGDNINFGSSPLTNGYIAKLASNGSHVWSKGFGEGAARALAVDGAGGIAMSGTGDVAGPLNFGGEDLMPLGEQDLFLATLNGLGDHVSSRRFGSPGDNRSNGRDVAINSKGNLAVAGDVEGNVIVDDAIIVGQLNAFTIRFAADGKVAWSKTFGRERCYIAFSSLDELVAACESYVAADFGKGLATPVGSSDLFLLKIAP